MLPRKHPGGIHIAFDDHRLVNNAGLILPATLALHLGLPQLVDRHLDLGRAPGRANTGDKMMPLVASALAGGDCIDDADALRTGGMACTLGGTLKAPSTLGTFLRSFHVLIKRCGRWHERRRRPAWRIDPGASVEAPAAWPPARGPRRVCARDGARRSGLRREPSGMRHRDAQGSSVLPDG